MSTQPYGNGEDCTVEDCTVESGCIKPAGHDGAHFVVTNDPRNSPRCWSSAEVGTPDAVIREIACGRGRHRWGKHRNRHVRWTCPPRCACIRHAAS